LYPAELNEISQQIENFFRSTKTERSGFLYPAEFFEICGSCVRAKKTLRSIFALRIYVIYAGRRWNL
jgi:hypothetical protein